MRARRTLASRRHSRAESQVYNLEIYASEAEFLEKMSDEKFQELSAQLLPLFGSNQCPGKPIAVADFWSNSGRFCS